MVTSIMCALLAVSMVSLADWTVGVLDAPEVTTRYGKVRGFYVDNVAIYYGVPFASPPVGSLRYVLGTERERGGERDRQTDRQTERERQRQTGRDRDRQTETDRQTDRRRRMNYSFRPLPLMKGAGG